jgi:hypothetical protein
MIQARMPQRFDLLLHTGSPTIVPGVKDARLLHPFQDSFVFVVHR